MSLLSNLLAFSSLNDSAQKQQRSASASGRFLFENDAQEITTEPKQRVVSKSLSKMGLLSSVNQTKVDPKYRCLHRMTHNLSMKIRKHYYALFVTLETLKKKNIYLNKKKQICPDKIEAAVAKVSQTFSIIHLKQFESTWKGQTFTKIKSYGENMLFPKTLQRVCQKNQFNFYGRRLLKYLNELQKMSMKFDLMQTSVEPVIKKCNKFVLSDAFKQLKICQKSKHLESPKKQNTEPRTVSIFQVFDKMQKRANSSSSTDKQPAVVQNNLNSSTGAVQKKKEPELYSKTEDRQTDIHEKKFKTNFDSNSSSDYPQSQRRQSEPRQRSSFDKNIYHEHTSSQLIQIPSLNRFHSLQSSPKNRSSSKNKSPYQISKRVMNLKQSVATDTLQSRNYQKVYKSYQICLNYEEKPYELSTCYESIPKIMTKIPPQQFSFHMVEDLADKSNIFRDFKGSKISSIENLQISNVICEPFMRAETLISDIERNREGQRSQISYAPFLPHDVSMESMINREQSNFGCDAVSFKNSLVMERQSMKKTQRQKIDMFVKKKTYIGNEGDHQSHQLQNLKNKRKSKNQFSDRKICENILPQTSFEQSYAFDSDYLIKRDSSVYEGAKIRPNINFQHTSMAWDEKKAHHEYNSQGKVKSYSFNSSSTDLIPRRLRFNAAEYDKKSGDDNYVSHISSNNISMNSTFRDPLAWKNQLLENRSVMPVRDVGLDPFGKIRPKNNISSQQASKDSFLQSSKKFISISKR